MFIEDEGYCFGLGAFETIAVNDGIPQFLDQHYKRLACALEFLRLSSSLGEVKQRVKSALADQQIQIGRKVLKIMVSEKNIIIHIRENNYKAEDYEKGFNTAFSDIRRNETSPFTYHKTFNYGDCIMEKRRFAAAGIQEPIFLNTKGEIAEGATTNVFFVKDQKVFTPPLSCGMLPGIIREYVLQTYAVEEKIISPKDIAAYDEMFLTNSLLGIMPVRKIGDHVFDSMDFGRYLMKKGCPEM